jgi:hypothetical protein
VFFAEAESYGCRRVPGSEAKICVNRGAAHAKT